MLLNRQRIGALMWKILAFLTLLFANAAIAQPVPTPPGDTALACAYNSSPPTLISGQFGYLQCDQNGKLLTSGGGGGVPAITAGDIVAGSGTGIQDSLSVGANGGISMSGGTVPTFLVGGSPCFWNDTNSCTTENFRGRERGFIGNAVNMTDSSSTCCSATWLGTNSTALSPIYLARDAQFLSMTDYGSIGLSGMARESDGGTNHRETIGTAGYALNDATSGSPNAWGGYFQCDLNVSGSASGNSCYGIEIDSVNYNSNVTSNPYSVVGASTNLWLAAGGAQSPTNPSNAAIITKANGTTFNSGIIFADGSLTKDGSSNSLAVVMGQGATFQWQVSSGVVGADIRSTVSTSGDDMSLVFANNQTQLQGPGNAALVNINASPGLTAPTISFATCGTNCGWLAPGSNQLEWVVNGAKIMDYGVTSASTLTLDTLLQAGSQSITNVNNLTAANTSGYRLVNTTASSTVPTLIPNQTSTSTGFGAQASGNISAVVSSVEQARFVSGGIILPTIGSDATHTDATVCEDTSTHQLYSGSGTAGICLGTSSARYKHDLAGLAEGLPEIMKLEPVHYRLNADHGDPTKLLYGFTAEQGAKALPSLVGFDAEGHPNTFDYLGVVPVLVHAIQQQQAEIENLKRRIR